MPYYIVASRETGELIQISTDSPTVTDADNVFVKSYSGGIPDLNKFEWRTECLAFVQKTPIRIITRLAFMRRLSNDELANIYSAAKTQPLLEVWLDKFKLAEEINLDDAEIISGLQWLEASGLLSTGRAAEVLV